VRISDEFRDDYDPGPEEFDARRDARADAKREAQEDARAFRELGRARGLQCQVCGSTFRKGDVISGCPDCGAYPGYLEPT
jgi:rubrerythrin